MEEYRVDVKVRNNLFLRKIEQAGYNTVGEFLRINGLIKYSCRLGKVINMKMSPLNFKGEFHSWLEKIADLLKCSCLDLFSDIQMNTVLKTNRRSIEVNEAEMKFMLESNPEPKMLEEIIYENQRSEKIEEILNTLDDREKIILKMRFGIGEYIPMNFTEIGKKLNISGSRVMQIEHRAMRILRHCSRAQIVREFLNNEEGI